MNKEKGEAGKVAPPAQAAGCYSALQWLELEHLEPSQTRIFTSSDFPPASQVVFFMKSKSRCNFRLHCI